MKRLSFLSGLRWITGVFTLLVLWSALSIGQTTFVTSDAGQTWSLQAEDPSAGFANPVGFLSLAGVQSGYQTISEKVDISYPAPVCFGDANHNGKVEMYRGVFIDLYNPFIRVTEFDLDMNETVTDLPFYGVTWDVGDIDDDGLADLFVQSGLIVGQTGFLRHYESPDASSYPTVLQQEVEFPGEEGYFFARIVDTDSDGAKEVLLGPNHGASGSVRIYEWDGSQLALRWTAPEISSWTGVKAVADFDGDMSTEIVTIQETLIPKLARAYENTGNDSYALRQTWELSQARVSCAEEVNVNGDDPEFLVGTQNGTVPNLVNEWKLYQNVGGFQEYASVSFGGNIWITIPKQTGGDYDDDGYDELVVNDHPTLKMWEYDGSMQVTWSSTQPDPVYLATGDMRLDGLNNFYVVNFEEEGYYRSYWEEERLANAYLGKSISQAATATNSQRKIVRESNADLHLVFESGNQIFYRGSTDGGDTWPVTRPLSNSPEISTYPCISERSGYLYTAWQQYNGSAEDGWDILYNYSTDGGNTWQEDPANAVSLVNCPTPGPLPVILAGSPGNSFEIMIVYKSSTGLHSTRSTTYQVGGNWSTPIQVTGTNSASQSPSLSYQDNSYGYYRLAWDEPDGVWGRIYHENYYTNSWSDLTGVNQGAYGITNQSQPSYGTTSQPEYDKHIAWEGVKNGRGVIVHNKNLSGVFTVFQSSTRSFQDPSITGHANGRATLVWGSDIGKIRKVVYDGMSWGPESNLADGFNGSSSVVNPQGGDAQVVWMEGSSSPYSLTVGSTVFTKPLAKGMNPGSSPIFCVNSQEVHATGRYEMKFGSCSPGQMIARMFLSWASSSGVMETRCQ